MAKALPILVFWFILFLFFSKSGAISLNNIGDNHEFARSVDSKLMFGLRKEKLSHFHFYWHDILSGKNQTTVQAVKPVSSTSATLFGAIWVTDDPLTVGPELSSKLIGKAQGFFAYASQEEIGLLMALNFVFIEGKYNGSTITILGRNQVLSKVREMPVIGGSGLFRFTRDYVKARTYKSDEATVVKYDVYVLHY